MTELCAGLSFPWLCSMLLPVAIILGGAILLALVLVGALYAVRYLRSDHRDY